MPINIDDYHLQMLANTFGCSVGTLPFAYLGLPLGTTRPNIQDLTPIVDQLERRLNASARFLDYGGRLQLINSVLSSLPNHYLSSLKIHKTIIKIADRSRRHCLWARDEDSNSSHSLAAWSLVCRPKQKGGLGIINFEIKNQALLLKQLHKFYCKADIPWVNLVWSLYATDVPPHAQSKRGSFWWRDVFSLVNTYRSISNSVIGDGTTTLFWKDFWNSGTNTETLMSDAFPRLFSYTLNEDISVADFIGSTIHFNLFALPLSVQAFDELNEVQDLLQHTITNESSNDTRIFSWGSPQYTSTKYYKFIFEALPKDTTMKAI
jgi:hypothetical protein